MNTFNAVFLQIEYNTFFDLPDGDVAETSQLIYSLPFLTKLGHGQFW